MLNVRMYSSIRISALTAVSWIASTRIITVLAQEKLRDECMKMLWFSADCFREFALTPLIDTYSMKTYALLHFEHESDVTIIVAAL